MNTNFSIEAATSANYAKQSPKAGNKCYAYAARFYGQEHTILSVNETARTAKVQSASGYTQIIPFCDLELFEVEARTQNTNEITAKEQFFKTWEQDIDQAKKTFAREYVIRIEGTQTQPVSELLGYKAPKQEQAQLESLHATAFFADEVEKFFGLNLENRKVTVKPTTDH